MFTLANVVITIARGYGSGGKTIGKMLAEEMNIEYYDKDLLSLASDDSGINHELFAKADETVKPALFRRNKVYRHELIAPDSSNFVSEDNLFNYQAKIIKDLALKSSCIIVGRCADFILKDSGINLARVFVHATMEACINNVVNINMVDPKTAKKQIDQIDKTRSEYYRIHTGRDWDNARNYDLCLDSSRLTFEQCVKIITEYIKIKNSL